MAESKRRGEDAVDEHLDEAFVDAVDDDTQDDLADDAPAGGSGRPSSSSTSTKVKASDEAKKAVAKKADASPGLYERIARFIREVVAELQKVNWPSRNELITYTAVVLVFVVIMVLIVAGLDWVFAWLVTHVFG